jgi:hypothetical protein
MPMRATRLIAAACLCAVAACATMSPASRVKSQLIALGVSEPRAECLAGELKDHLDKSDLNDVANFLEDLNRAQTPGNALDALLKIENPRAAAAIASAGITCALGG